jgi:hypothetical protein
VALLSTDETDADKMPDGDEPLLRTHWGRDSDVLGRLRVRASAWRARWTSLTTGPSSASVEPTTLELVGVSSVAGVRVWNWSSHPMTLVGKPGSAIMCPLEGVGDPDRDRALLRVAPSQGRNHPSIGSCSRS